MAEQTIGERLDEIMKAVQDLGKDLLETKELVEELVERMNELGLPYSGLDD